MIGISDGKPNKSMFLSTQILENVKNQAIIEALKKASNHIWPNTNIFRNLYLILSDQAPTNLAVMKNSRENFPNALNITCIAHGLHRVCEKIRKNNSKANKFISLMKKVLRKSPFKKIIYKYLQN